MSEIRETKAGAPEVPEQTRGAHQREVGTGPGKRRSTRAAEPTAWAGWVVFAAVVMILLGAFQAIAGLVALFNHDLFKVSTSGLLVHASYATWGWVHLLVALVALFGGLGLISGAMWGRVVGVCVAMVSAVVNLGFLAAYPVWAVTVITLDVVVIYAITAHGAEVRALD
ncbi:MAG: DUF7144 family membrane protein [Nocardioidaceae bacterium]